jgi:hypothetical protein
MVVRWATAVMICLVALGATQAVADTRRFHDPRPSAGPHDIRRLVVDNTGARVGATAVHAGARWHGTVRLAFDVTGGPAADFVAVLDHARPRAAKLMRADGRPWQCTGRRTVSRPASRRTVLLAPRRCLDRAPKMRVRATVRPVGSRSQTLSSTVVQQQSRPNIVMIMADDMRADDLRFMPGTRRLIARKGVNFRNGFSTYPSCCPARASVLSGQYTHNHRVFSIDAPWGFTSFDDSSTLATWLRRSGYAAVYLGKYLNGYGWMPEPGAESGRSVRYVPPGWVEWRASIDAGLGSAHPKAGGTYRYFNTTLSRNGVAFDNYRGQYQTQVYGDLSEQIIRSRAASDRPFFLYASYTAPHTNGRMDEGGPRVPRDDGLETAFGAVARPDEFKGMFDRTIAAAPGASWSDPDISDKPRYLRSLPPVNDAERLLCATSRRRVRREVLDRSGPTTSLLGAPARRGTPRPRPAGQAHHRRPGRQRGARGDAGPVHLRQRLLPGRATDAEGQDPAPRALAEGARADAWSRDPVRSATPRPVPADRHRADPRPVRRRSAHESRRRHLDAEGRPAG